MSKAGDEGMAVAASHADPKDIAAMRGVAEMLARRDNAFSSEDVMHLIAEAERERLAAFPNVIGGVMRALHRAGVIEPTAYVPSVRPEARGHIIRLWQGVR